MIGGLKAAISNPNTSSEAKERATERLQELGEPEYTSSPPEPAQHELGTHQIAGYKATLTSSCISLCLHTSVDRPFTDPNVSDEAKQHARDVLETEGDKAEAQTKHSPSASHHDEHTRRVLAGYKAALHSKFLVSLIVHTFLTFGCSR